MTSDDIPPTSPRGFGATLVAVLWSFIGLRRRRDFERDVHGLRPAYVLLCALLAAAAFIALLLSAARLATG